MKAFEKLLKRHGHVHQFHAFQTLMRHRVRDVLLVSSLYDSFIFEEDGQLYERILSEYHDLNLSQAPSLTRVDSGSKAIQMATQLKRFDLIITTLNLGDMDALEFAKKIKARKIKAPVVLLTHDSHGLNEFLAHQDTSDFFKVFVWQGDFRILIALIKLVEDRLNVEHDSREVGVQSIILIEDNVQLYYSYIPLI
jgi:CheY-like chemotaxis protein